MPQTPTVPYDLAGFLNVHNHAKWGELLLQWLPTFEPTAFLIGRINSEAPMGPAATAWTTCARAMTNLLRQTEEQTEFGQYLPNDTHDQLQMLTRCMPILLLRVPRTATHATKTKIVQQNCTRFLQGNWRGLVATAKHELQDAAAEAAKRASQTQPATAQSAPKRSLQFAAEQARKLNLGKAMHILRAPGLATGDHQTIVDSLHSLHPPEEQCLDQSSPPGLIAPGKETFNFITGEWLGKILGKAKAGTAVDQWGWDCREMWAPLRKDDDLLHDIARYWIRPVAAGYLPLKYRADLAGGRLVALSKFPKPGIRPICISDTWRRLAAKGLGATANRHFQAFFQESQCNALQFGGNTLNGASNMYHLLTSVAESVSDIQLDQQNPRTVPTVILALDSANAFKFNTLLRKQLETVLQQGTAQVVNSLLKYFHNGKVACISSKSGVQQGDLLDSTLFALAIHPILIKLGSQHNVLITAYADNVVFSGPLSRVVQAQDAFRTAMLDVGLRLNPAESEMYIPEWRDVPLQQAQEMLISSESPSRIDDAEAFLMLNGDFIPWRRQGIKILGCPIGSAQFCTDVLRRTATKIEEDLRVLTDFPSLHHRIKLATYCSNTRATYFLRAVKMTVSVPLMQTLDKSFDSFMAATLNFPEGFQTDAAASHYSQALQQIRLGIKQGGCGLTSAALIIPAALFSAICAFTRWLHYDKHLPLTALDWLFEHTSKHPLGFRHIHDTLDSSLGVLETQWGFQGSDICPSQGDSFEPTSRVIPNSRSIVDWKQKKIPSQHHLVNLMKVDVRESFLDSISEFDRVRMASVSLQLSPANSPESAIGTSSLSTSNTLKQSPMGLFALTCPYELSNPAVLTSLAISLGYPVPHARFLKAREVEYNSIDVWGDSLLNCSSHAAGTWHSSHNRVAQELAQVATFGGIPTTANEAQIPCISATSRQRGDMMTRVGGRVPLQVSPHFDKFTRLIMDVQLGHVFKTHIHELKTSSIKDMETRKRRQYTDAYRAIGFAFAPLVANSWGVCGPDLLRFLWAVADHAARNAYSLPLDRILTLSQPAHSEIDPPSEATMLSFKILRGRLNLDYRLRLLTAIYEAFTERVFGRTHALVSHPEYLEHQAAARAVWQPTFSSPPPLSSSLSPVPSSPCDSSVEVFSGAYLPPSPSLLPRSSSVVVSSVSRSQVLLPGSSYALALLQDCFRPIPP